MDNRERFLRNLQESMQLSSFMASLVLKAAADLTSARRRYCCHTEPRSVGCIVDRVQAMENVKGTQRNNGSDWHKDCNKTRQPHWHSGGFRAAKRGEPAVHKSLLKRCLPQGAVPRLPSAGLQLTWRPQERGYPDGFHSSAKRRSCGGTLGKATARAMAQVRWGSSG